MRIRSNDRNDSLDPENKVLTESLGGTRFFFATPFVTPEMDPGLITSAMALLSGGLLIIAGRKVNR